jgi:competence protein ComEA
VSDLPRSHVVAYVLLALAVVAFGVHQLGRRGAAAGAVDAGGGGGRAGAIQVQRGGDGGGGVIVVHVAGAVRRPGVYRLRAGARVEAAVRRAGGLRRRADVTQINLAAKLEDGRQVVVPEKAPAGDAAVAGAPGVAGAPAGPVNLNTATAEQLDTLDGVGPATAAKILRYRQENGGFSSVEELGQIAGIGERRLAALREQVGL